MADANESAPVTDLPIAWKNSVLEAMTALWTKVAEFVPSFFGMLVIVILGYLISKGLAKITVAVLTKAHFETASNRTGLGATLSKVGIKASASEIVGKLVFWLFMLTFLISASETLGLENVSRTIDTFVDYLPNVIAAALIGVLGLMLAHFIRSVVETAAEGLGFEYSRAVSRLVHIVLIVVVGTLAIDQLGIETNILNSVIEIVLIATGAAVAIAIGLGTRNVANSVVAGVYARDIYKPGTDIRFKNIEGSVDSIGSITTRVRTTDGNFVHIPNDQLVQSIVWEDVS